ncbi:MAG: phosphoribosylglycinamide formyltransferase [Candidatus Aenigmatarchaeota archaeon]|nr:MAG: phosphoribosylglycinamide formyltransferase [Candidatus Aenigmarchaeota archaeon]
MGKLKIGVLGSTAGTDMQAVIDEIEKGALDAEISVVICNKPDAFILERAKKHGLKAVCIPSKSREREDFDREVASILEENGVQLILLIGYMRFLSKWFVDRYENRIMNIHPSLLPAFAGGMDLDVHQAILDHGAKVTGATLHFVDEGADTGPIILQKAVDIAGDETKETLKPKVQKAEQEIILRAIRLFADGKLKVEGRKVKILG